MLWTLCVIVVSMYAGVLLALFVLQRGMIFAPMTTHADVSMLVGAEEIKLTTSDGETLVAWYLPPQSDKPLIVYFHGNSGTLTNRALKFQVLAREGFGVLAVSYRGYGGSTGAPSEQGLYTDARAAMAKAHALGFADDRLIVFGESLGTGVAVQMATEFVVRALVLESPYTSIANRSQELYPYLPVYWLVRDRFDSLAKIPAIQSPLLVLHGEDDPTIPPAHGRALLAAASGVKEGVFLPGVAHTDIPLELIAERLTRFISQTENP
jgi:fermentation-respiration switch protein FrsA (DUF1100 family)